MDNIHLPPSPGFKNVTTVTKQCLQGFYAFFRTVTKPFCNAFEKWTIVNVCRGCNGCNAFFTEIQGVKQK